MEAVESSTKDKVAAVTTEVLPIMAVRQSTMVEKLPCLAKLQPRLATTHKASGVVATNTTKMTIASIVQVVASTTRLWLQEVDRSRIRKCDQPMKARQLAGLRTKVNENLR